MTSNSLFDIFSPYGENINNSENISRIKVYKEREIIEKIEKRLTEIFEEVPFIFVKKSKKRAEISPLFRADIMSEISFNNKKKNIIVEVKSVGEPRYIRAAVQKLAAYLKQYPEVYGVIAAPYISENTGKICKEANIGYIDLSGNCFISFDTIYINKKKYKSIVSTRSEVKSLFSKKTTRILRVLLNNPKKSWTQINLSNKSKVSIGLTNKVIKRLYTLEYVDFNQNKRITLKNPSKLLDLWRDKYSYSDNEVVRYYSPLSQIEFEKRLIKYMSQRNIEVYAFTLFSGTASIAPFVRTNQTFFYFSGNIKKLVKEIGLKPVTTGANILILIPYDEGVFYTTRKIDRKNIVSNIQLYLDLYNYKGRGREQAEYLREKAIKF